MRALLSDKPLVLEQFLLGVDKKEKESVLASRSSGKATLLHLMVVPQKVPARVIDLMLANGANLAAVDENGQSAFHWLVRKNRVTLLRCLIERVEHHLRSRHEEPRGRLAEILNAFDYNGHWYCRSRSHSSLGPPNHSPALFPSQCSPHGGAQLLGGRDRSARRCRSQR